MKSVHECDELLGAAGKGVVCGFLCMALGASPAPLAAIAQTKAWWEAGQRISSAQASSASRYDGSRQELLGASGTKGSEDVAVGGAPRGVDSSLVNVGGRRGGDDAGHVGEEQDQGRGGGTSHGQRTEEQEDDKEREEKPSIKRVSIAGEVVTDDGLYGSGALKVALDKEVDIDSSGTCVRLYDEDGEPCKTVGVARSSGKTRRSLLEFSLEDGDYSKVECVVRSRGGEETTASFSRIGIDTEGPIVELEYDPALAAYTKDGWQYFDAAQRVSVRMVDPHLDAERTTLNGSSLADLIERGDGAPDPLKSGIAYTSWEAVQDDRDRIVGYAVEMTFSDGVYRMPLAEAFDGAGNRTLQEVPLGNGTNVLGFTVDVSAPEVKPTLDQSPTRVVSDSVSGRPIAFFNEPLTLKLWVADVLSGIARVDGVQGYETKQLYDERGGLAGLSVALPEGIFTDSVKFVVHDCVGNERVWSMGPEGAQTVLGEESVVENAPLRREGGLEEVVPGGHPALLVRDETTPVLTLEGIEDGMKTNASQTLTLTISDAFLGYAMVHDPGQVVLSVSRDGERVGGLDCRLGDCESPDVLATSATYRTVIAADKKTHENDGTYEVHAKMRDLAGNETHGGEDVVQSFTIDTVAPELEVSFEDEATQNHASEGRWFGAKRTARISVRDKSFSVDKLNEGGLVHVEPTARDGHALDDVMVGVWHEGTLPNEYSCDVEFPADGTYSLSVCGADEAGNVLVGTAGTEVDENGRYDAGDFVIDSTAPQVMWEYGPGAQAPNRVDGIDYFRRPVDIRLFVKDRNFDERLTSVTDSEGKEVAPVWSVLDHTDDGIATHVASITYREEETGTDAGRKAPHVRAIDLVGNVSNEAIPAFVIDQTAPTLDEVRVSKAPDAEGRDDVRDDPYQFFNEREGVPTTITFGFSDEYLLETAWVDDPDGAYEVRQQGPYHQRSGSLTLALKDFEEDGAMRDVDMERNVRLYVRDVAGNVREWTCDRTGAIVADRVTSSANISLNGLGVYPYALIKDTTAPLITLSGIEEGKYYNVPQTEHIVVSEHNFDYLARFDPKRTLVTVREWDDAEGVASNSWAITADQFVGSSPYYSYDQAFNNDGHYRVEASFDDYAGNASQRSTLEEFTIDRTAPVIDVSWDNVDVRNARYYRAPRVATIVVREHNFDPGLMSIDTTGVIGGWSSNGDVHTCEVAFRTEASTTNPHRLSVRGRDKADNEANPYVEPDFVIDTQAPTVSVLKRVSEGDRMEAGEQVTTLVDGSAFSQAVVPMVEIVDDSNFDAQGVEVSLVGLREGAVGAWETMRRVQPMGDTGERVDWGNIGFADGEEGPYYRLGADDVYTIKARATDLAGNVSEEASVSFSVNRYGSNFFFEESDGLRRDEDGSWDATPLTSAPRIVVHEVNVSGAAAEGDGGEDKGHTVTKEYANATSAIGRTQHEQRNGYTLSSSTEASPRNPYEGWTEYTYTIQPGNFGRGSDSDYGDGGQGTYRVDVSSRDKAHNNNTTAEYWESGVSRGGVTEHDESQPDLPRDKTATVCFTLDQDGPAIEDVDVPTGFVAGSDYTASFRLVDQITNGDYVSVTVDGKPVEVRGDELAGPVLPDVPVQQGIYTFDIAAKSAFAPREVEIHVCDYTGLEERSQTVRMGGFRVSTLVVELILMIGTLMAGLFVRAVVRRRRQAAEPKAPHA